MLMAKLLCWMMEATESDKDKNELRGKLVVVAPAGIECGCVKTEWEWLAVVEEGLLLLKAFMGVT
jgi:hypothetical protein